MSRFRRVNFCETKSTERCVHLIHALRENDPERPVSWHAASLIGGESASHGTQILASWCNSLWKLLFFYSLSVSKGSLKVMGKRAEKPWQEREERSILSFHDIVGLFFCGQPSKIVHLDFSSFKSMQFSSHLDFYDVSTMRPFWECCMQVRNGNNIIFYSDREKAKRDFEKVFEFLAERSKSCLDLRGSLMSFLLVSHLDRFVHFSDGIWVTRSGDFARRMVSMLNRKGFCG